MVRRVKSSHFSSVVTIPNPQLLLQIRVSSGGIQDPGTQGTCKGFRE
jgi:hypothetical protein